MNVAVIGAGVVGLNAAWQLAQRGHVVTVFDQFQPGHTHGSSHGRSRIVRKAYPDPLYTGFMIEGYGLWRDLELALERTLIHEVGLLYFGPESSPDLRTMTEGLASHSVPFEVLKPAQVQSVFPSLHLDPGEVGVWTKEAGWVEADQVMSGLVTLCKSNGVTFQLGQICSLETSWKGFDRWVVCAGSWIQDWVDLPVHVSVQTTAYVRHQHQGPVWVEDSADLCYGFPSEEAGLKIGVHRPGPSLPPRPSAGEGGGRGRQEQSLDPDTASLEAIRQTATRRFSIEDPELTEITRCRYTNAPNEDFIWGFLPETQEQGLFVSACSGHAFKFGPWLGRRIAEFVEGNDSPASYDRLFWKGKS